MRAAALAILVSASPASGSGFLAAQLRFPRVREAFARAQASLQEAFRSSGSPYPPGAIYLRAFKRERVLELWAGPSASSPLSLVRSYPICRFSGGLGPKRREGDLQVPEGFYRVERFNPQSQFLLSLGLDYPNESDRRLGHGPALGGDIFIHGNCVSIGCMAMTDPLIREIYAAAVLARDQGQSRIPVHVFPSRFDAAGLAVLQEEARRRPREGLMAFWEQLRPAYEAFERSRLAPRTRVASDGSYRVEP